MSLASSFLLSFFGAYFQPNTHKSATWNYKKPLIAFIACRTMATRENASSIFTEFESNGWPTTGLACLVGLNGPIPYLTGADSSVHLAEELKNSAYRLPRSMLVTAITNYITSFIIVGTFAFIIAYSTSRR